MILCLHVQHLADILIKNLTNLRFSYKQKIISVLTFTWWMVDDGYDTNCMVSG